MYNINSKYYSKINNMNKLFQNIKQKYKCIILIRIIFFNCIIIIT